MKKIYYVIKLLRKKVLYRENLKFMLKKFLQTFFYNKLLSAKNVNILII